MDRSDALWKEYQVLRVAGSASEIRSVHETMGFCGDISHP